MARSTAGILIERRLENKKLYMTLGAIPMANKDRVQALTTEDIRDAFARHLPASERVIITVGPPQPEPETEQDNTNSETDGDSAAQTTEGEDA